MLVLDATVARDVDKILVHASFATASLAILDDARALDRPGKLLVLDARVLLVRQTRRLLGVLDTHPKLTVTSQVALLLDLVCILVLTFLLAVALE